MEKYIKKRNIYIIFAIIIFFIGYFPFVKNFYVNCDGQFYLSRIEAIYLNLKQGIFLPNIQAGNMNGYGYLIDVFYPCLFYYLPAVLRFVFPVNICFYLSLCIYKVVFIYLTYIFGERVLKDKEKSLSFTLIYYSNIVFIYDIFVRECFSEYIASLILPLFIFGLIDLFENNKYKLLILSMSLILGTHLITLYLCSFIVFICLGIDIKKNKFKHLKSLCIATISTFLLGSCFIIPFIKYFKDYQYSIPFRFLTINSAVDNIYVLLFVIFIVIITIFFKKRKINRYLYASLLLIYIISPLFPIGVFSFLSIIQFKSRLYIFLILSLILFVLDLKNTKINVYIIKFMPIYSLFFMCMISFSKNALNLEQLDLYNGQTWNYTTLSNFDTNYMTIINGEYLPKDFDFIEYNGDINVFYDDLRASLKTFDKVSIIENNNAKIAFKTDLTETYVPKIYYPFYEVSQKDNENIKYENKDGYMYVSNIYPNEEFILEYKNTFIQYISFIISCIFCIFICLKQKKIV